MSVSRLFLNLEFSTVLQDPYKTTKNNFCFFGVLRVAVCLTSRISFYSSVVSARDTYTIFAINYNHSDVNIFMSRLNIRDILTEV
jgi:hypothetical protein